MKTSKKSYRLVSFMLVLILVLAVALTGCGGSDTGDGETSENTTETETSDESASEDETQGDDEAAAEQTEGGNILVVYYSAQGHTEAVANTIAETLGADTFVITPVEPYTSDDLNYNNSDSRVSKEHEDPDLQEQVELETTEVENWEQYDTVFFGYPIWWGNAAWPVNQFVESNDFTGKTVITFCTSASSGLGDSTELLAEKAGTGEWKDGQRFSSNASADDVAEWAEEYD
ncbi:MAG: flavodoxin [Eubacterium sp.]|jgi:flavodoxin